MLQLLVALACVGPLAADDAKPELSQRFGVVHSGPDFLVELGSGWNRFDFIWSGIERTRGNFDFHDLPKQVEESHRQGVNILPILDYGPPWNPDVSPADDESLALWERYVEKTVGRFKGKLPYWQVWNEPNISFWKPKPNPRDYAELLRRSRLAIKRADPEAKIVGVNCSDIDLEFTEQVFRYGGLEHCDVVACQPYRIAPEVGHFEEVDALRALMDRFGEPRPIWFTEMGWNTIHFPFTDAADRFAERPCRRQAAFIVRYMTIIQAAGIDKVFFFAQYDLFGPKGKKKRPAYFAYRHLIATLGPYREVRELIPRGSGGVHAYLFSCPDQSVVVAWSVNGDQELGLPEAVNVREVRDVFGQPKSRPDTGPLIVGGEPVYLLYDDLPAPLKQTASLRVRPSRIWLEPGQRETVTLRWDPIDGTERACDLTVRVPTGLHVKPETVSLNAGEEATLAVSAGKDARPARDALSIRSGAARWDVELNVTPRTLWAYQGESMGYLSPSLLRDADGSVAVLVATYDTPEILCLSPKGERLWTYTAGVPINCSVTTGNINDDPRPEIVAAMPSRQTVFALTADGVLLWRNKLPGDPPTDHPGWARWTRPVVADLDRDGRDEVVYADPYGHVTAISGDGRTIWRKRISERRCDRPVCIRNIRGDEHVEILVGDEAGTLFCLSHTGETIWSTETGANIATAVVAGRLRPDEPPSIFVGTHGERLLRITRDGQKVWSADIGGTMDLGTGIVLADLNGDDTREVVCSTRNDAVIALDANGKILWRAVTGAQLRSTPAVGDVDGDGESEILIGSSDRRLYAIDPRGKVEWTVEVGNRVDASPLLADLDGDGVRDIILPARGGNIMALSAAPVAR